MYTSGVNMKATHHKNMTFGKSSADGVITGTSKSHFKEEVKMRGISIKTHEMTRSTFNHDNYYKGGEDWHKYPKNVSDKSPIEGSTPKKFYKPIMGRLDANLSTKDITTPKAQKSIVFSGTTGNDYNKYFSADKPQEEDLGGSGRFSGKLTKESDTSTS